MMHRGIPEVVTIAGGIADAPAHATAGAHRWQQMPDESAEQFRDRVIVAATASREPVLVIGGLP